MGRVGMKWNPSKVCRSENEMVLVAECEELLGASNPQTDLASLSLSGCNSRSLY